MSDVDTDSALAKGFLTVVVIGLLLADPIPGDIVLAPPIIGAIWGLEEELPE